MYTLWLIYIWFSRSTEFAVLRPDWISIYKLTTTLIAQRLGLVVLAINTGKTLRRSVRWNHAMHNESAGGFGKHCHYVDAQFWFNDTPAGTAQAARPGPPLPEAIG